MLDVGFRLESQRQQIVDRLAAGMPESWDDQSLDDLRGPTKASARGLPQKLVYGSDFPYRVPAELIQINQHKTDLVISHALGGLSTAWGANVLPFLAQDITNWPIGLAELAPYYRAVFSFVDLAAREDRLAQLFPFHAERHQPLQLSRQAEALLTDLERHRETLTHHGFEYGQSRLAVRAYPKSGDAGCVYCGLCLYGCPYKLIYCSAQTLPELQQFPNFKYVPGYYVERLAESPAGITIHARRVADGQTQQFSAERVFLGCGTISTTKIVLESLGALNQEVLVRDSQYFLTPLLRFHPVPDVTTERLYTLSQICLLLRDPALSPRSVHMLVYTYNDLYRRALERLLPFRSVRNSLLARLMIVQGYLHSEDSATLTMRVERAAGADLARVILEGRPNPRTRAMIRQVLRCLRAVAPGLRSAIVPFMTHVVAPGKSDHVGASLPISSAIGLGGQRGSLACTSLTPPASPRCRPQTSPSP
jgi:ferredoxin